MMQSATDSLRFADVGPRPRAIAFSGSKRQPCARQVLDCTRLPNDRPEPHHQGRRGRDVCAKYVSPLPLVCALPVDQREGIAVRPA